ncbi:DUF1801 domain-containing protein [Chitinophaga sp. NPDC101104]|uniref:DUF1801 domain-containing protein n=1 Tax=Chitinophaga sp. NPDC101104 TaxID=3390561 RepID=UPI003D00C1BB
MTSTDPILSFLSAYSGPVRENALRLRKIILSMLPGVTERADLPAKMIAYAFGPRYAELVCVLIPSKTELKLGFNEGASLPDPHHLLEGTGKKSRYIRIRSSEDIDHPAIPALLQAALEAYRQRTAP